MSLWGISDNNCQRWLEIVSSIIPIPEPILIPLSADQKSTSASFAPMLPSSAPSTSTTPVASNPNPVAQAPAVSGPPTPTTAAAIMPSMSLVNNPRTGRRRREIRRVRERVGRWYCRCRALGVVRVVAMARVSGGGRRLVSAKEVGGTRQTRDGLRNRFDPGLNTLFHEKEQSSSLTNKEQTIFKRDDHFQKIKCSLVQHLASSKSSSHHINPHSALKTKTPPSHGIEETRIENDTAGYSNSVEKTTQIVQPPHTLPSHS